VNGNSTEMTSIVAAFGAAVIGVVRSNARRPFTIPRIDASADTLWPPVVREEADPPRWRLELLATRQASDQSA
jgi:hypothetical protein